MHRTLQRDGINPFTPPLRAPAVRTEQYAYMPRGAKRLDSAVPVEISRYRFHQA